MEVYEAKHSYNQEADSVLTFNAGETFYILGRPSEKWWLAKRVIDNAFGYVPAVYLQPAREKVIGKLVPENRRNSREYDIHLKALAELHKKVQPSPAHVIETALAKEPHPKLSSTTSHQEASPTSLHSEDMASKSHERRSVEYRHHHTADETPQNSSSPEPSEKEGNKAKEGRRSKREKEAANPVRQERIHGRGKESSHTDGKHSKRIHDRERKQSRKDETHSVRIHGEEKKISGNDARHSERIQGKEKVRSHRDGRHSDKIKDRHSKESREARLEPGKERTHSIDQAKEERPYKRVTERSQLENDGNRRRHSDDSEVRQSWQKYSAIKDRQSDRRHSTKDGHGRGDRGYDANREDKQAHNIPFPKDKGRREEYTSKEGSKGNLDGRARSKGKNGMKQTNSHKGHSKKDSGRLDRIAEKERDKNYAKAGGFPGEEKERAHDRVSRHSKKDSAKEDSGSLRIKESSLDYEENNNLVLAPWASHSSRSNSKEMSFEGKAEWVSSSSQKHNGRIDPLLPGGDGDNRLDPSVPVTSSLGISSPASDDDESTSGSLTSSEDDIFQDSPSSPSSLLQGAAAAAEKVPSPLEIDAASRGKNSKSVLASRKMVSIDNEEDVPEHIKNLPSPPLISPPPPDYDLNRPGAFTYTNGKPYHHKMNISSHPDGERIPIHEDEDEVHLVKPKPLVNPVLQSKERMDLHRELMHSGRKVLDKPELSKVFRDRKITEKKKEAEKDQESRRSSMEIKLMERQEMLEKEEKKGKLAKEGIVEDEEEASKPEFAKVKLRHTNTSKT